MSCTIEEGIEKYDLDETVITESIDMYLLSRWKGTGQFPETGVRPLTEWYNKKLLETVYDNNGVSSINSHINVDYETLTGDDEVAQSELREQLEQQGIDVDELKSYIVSSSTMYRHLTGCLGETKEKKGKTKDWEKRRIRYAKEIVKNNVREILSTKDIPGEQDIDERFSFHISLTMYCNVCGEGVDVDRYLNDEVGLCNCRTQSEEKQ